ATTTSVDATGLLADILPKFTAKTNIAELKLWRLAGRTSEALTPEKWYRNIGGDMAQALNAASTAGAYTLSDRATWLAFASKGTAGDRHRRRSASAQPLRCDRIEPEKARQASAARSQNPGRLAGLARRPESDGRLPEKRR